MSGFDIELLEGALGRFFEIVKETGQDIVSVTFQTEDGEPVHGRVVFAVGARACSGLDHSVAAIDAARGHSQIKLERGEA